MSAIANLVGPALPDPLPVVRETVRALLLATPSYHELTDAQRKRLAQSMVRVCNAAAEMIREEVQLEREVQPIEPVLTRAQSAGSQFSGVAADRVAGTTQAILNAVSFPRFVTELINGVFKAMVDSSIQQMQSFVELLNNVSASLDGFSDSNMGADRARMWLADKYPGSFEISLDEDDEEAAATLRLREGGSMPSEAALRTDLGATDEESVPGGNPEALVPFVRRHLSKQRQSMLASMVMLGLQRIVVESGSIRASMRFHIDTRSAAQSDQGSRFSLDNQIKASGSFGMGPWGASASVTNNIGYVSTQRNQTTEEMNTDLELTSAVEINFKSDYLPLNRLASNSQAQKIRANTLNPEEEARKAETDRRKLQSAAESERSKDMGALLRPPAPAPTPAAPPPTPAPAAPRPAAPAANQPTPPPATPATPTPSPARPAAPAQPASPTPAAPQRTTTR